MLVYFVVLCCVGLHVAYGWLWFILACYFVDCDVVWYWLLALLFVTLVKFVLLLMFLRLGLWLCCFSWIAFVFRLIVLVFTQLLGILDDFGLMCWCVIVLLFVGCFRVCKLPLYFSRLCLLLLGCLCERAGGGFVYWCV